VSKPTDLKNAIKTNSYICCVMTDIGCAALLAGAHAQPQAYPAKPIRIIVSSTAGGGSDFIGRLLAQKLSEAVGQQVIVENRAGAGGTLGIEAGIRAAPDGYTFNVITPSYAVNPSLYTLKFDPANDFTAVVPVARGPLVASIHPSVIGCKIDIHPDLPLLGGTATQ
jgi:tripartite-type tricarboxylate transporter receptor subunit TctC